MKITKQLSSFLMCLVIMSTAVLSGNITVAYASEQLVSFPSAEGGGMYTEGARASKNMTIYHVTNLNDDGAGSLRNGVAGNNRIIVFDVAGNIMLESDLKIKASNLTILGQTAPGEGICIAGSSVRFEKVSNIILRYVKDMLK